jgi:hypothetical protein
MTESRRVEWTEIGWLEVDSATVGFGDNACRSVIGKPLLDLHFARGDGHGPIIDFTAYGVPMIGFLTMIHSFGAHRFQELFDNVTVQTDGQWWSV